MQRFMCLIFFLSFSLILFSQRPFGPKAPWNIPVANIPIHTDSDVYVNRLWNDSPSDRPGNFNLNFDWYTYPVYETDSSEKHYPVSVKYKNWGSNLDSEKIPFDPNWKPADGTDAQIIILDTVKGYEWDLWQVNFENDTVKISNGNLVQAGEKAGKGNPGNYKTKENGFAPSRGIGIQYLAMLVRPEEIEAGVIEHALSMPISNPDNSFYVPPATKLENSPGAVENGIPEGMRFALRISDAEINAYINSLPNGLPQATKRAARIIVTALRDYGWFITDTSGGASLQFEAVASVTWEKWEELGLGKRKIDWKEYPRDLLDGALEQNRIVALVDSESYPITHNSLMDLKNNFELVGVYDLNGNLVTNKKKNTIYIVKYRNIRTGEVKSCKKVYR